jgi:NADH-quinone oxidoreductase subunit M
MNALTWLVVLPAIGALAVALVPRRRSELLLPVGVALTVPPLALALWVVANFETGDPMFQFTVDHTLSESLGIGWRLGVDGISLWMVALTAVLFPLAIAASTSITDRRKQFVVSMLILEAGLLGVFLALDLVLFFAFFEVVLVPMYFLIGVWGSGRRRYAAMKFILFSAFGSIFLLAGVIGLGVLGGDAVDRVAEFDLRAVLDVPLSSTSQLLLFLAFGVAFAVKVPIVPFHTWLPDAHTEAPTAGSVILAGVLLKMGGYGLIRFNLTLFPKAATDLALVLSVLGVVGIVYGAIVAIVQPDLKRLVAYSSISHMGFVVLGVFALTVQGISGGVFVMLSHGLVTGALFLLVGMLYERRHTRMIEDYGGVASVMPIYAGLFLYMAFASIGLPGLSGFIGEFTVLVGSYLSVPVLAVVGASGVVLAAVYLLWAYERVFTGPITNPANEALRDVGMREIAIMVPLVVLVLAIGVYPKPVLDRVQPSVDLIMDRIAAATDYEAPEFGGGG